MFHALPAKLRHWRSLIRIACVLAVAMASILHVAADFRSVQAGSLAVSAAPSDADRSADIAAEACHVCAVVAYFSSDQKMDVAGSAAAIPPGRALRLFAFQQAATTPPPRVLT